MSGSLASLKSSSGESMRMHNVCPLLALALTMSLVGCVEPETDVPASPSELAAAPAEGEASPREIDDDQGDPALRTAGETLLEQRGTRDVVLPDGAVSLTTCQTNSLLCASSALGIVLACTAALSAGGANYIADIACANALAAQGLSQSCKNAKNSCNFGQWNGTTSNGANVGSTSNLSRSQTSTCTGNNGSDRVKGVRFWTTNAYGGKVISRFQLYCTNGQILNFGNNSGDGVDRGTTTCSAGYLVQGFDSNWGDVIDRMNIRCDKVTDTTSADSTAGSVGGGGGDPGSSLCTEGRYVYGMDVSFRQNQGQELVARFRAKCKN